MARWRKIDVRVWSDERFRRLSRPQPNAQTLWLYLLTGPHTNSIPGLFCIGEAAMAEAIGWSLKGFREGFAELFREGLVEADWEARVVWIKNAIRYNPPDNPNVVKSWRVAWDETPECPLKDKAWQALKGFMEGYGKGFAEGFAKACPKGLANGLANGMANKEQEQEQEQESPLPPEGAVKPAAVFDAWNRIAAEVGMPTVKTLSSARRRAILTRIGEGHNVERFEAAFRLIGADPYLMGQNDGGKVYADFDYAMSSKGVKWLDKAAAGALPSALALNGLARQPRFYED